MVLEVERVAKDIVVDARGGMQAVLEIAVADEIDLVGLWGKLASGTSDIHVLVLLCAGAEVRLPRSRGC